MTSKEVETKPGGNWENREKRHSEFEAIVEKAIQGDESALCSLCEKLAKSIMYRARYMLGNDMDAEDVTQNVLLRVFENIKNLRESRAFRSWLSGIIINETRRYISEHSKHGVHLNIDDYFDTLIESKAEWLPCEHAESRADQKSVMEIVSRLPNRQHQAVMLRYYNDMSVTEVAQAMRIPHQCVSKYLTLALNKLRAEAALTCSHIVN